MKDKFVKLTYAILEMRGLSSTDKIVLAYRLGFQTFYRVKPKTVAAKLHLGVKTAERSITKLRKLGLWDDEDCSLNVRSPERQSSGEAPKKLGGPPKMLGATPKILGDDKAVSPMKTEALLDSILDIKLDNNKIVTLDSSTSAPQHSKETQTFYKKLDKISSDSIITKSGLVRVSEDEVFNGVVEKGTEPAAAPPLDDGVPLTRQEMIDANLSAYLNGKPQPYTATQVARGRVLSEAEQMQAEVDKVFGELASTYSNEKGLQKAV